MICEEKKALHLEATYYRKFRGKGQEGKRSTHLSHRSS